jgi:hypothetical protein
MILDKSVARIEPARQRFECFREVAAGMVADVYKCIERGQMSMALTAAATRQVVWVGMLGAASFARWIARDEECHGLAHDLLETLLAGLSRTSSLLSRDVGDRSQDRAGRTRSSKSITAESERCW